MVKLALSANRTPSGNHTAGFYKMRSFPGQEAQQQRRTKNMNASRTTRPQCTATTAKGTRCKQKAAGAGRTCGTHRRQDLKNKIAQAKRKQEEAINAANERTARKFEALKKTAAALNPEAKKAHDAASEAIKNAKPTPPAPLTITISGCRELTPHQEREAPAAILAAVEAIQDYKIGGTRPLILHGNAKGIDRLADEILTRNGYEVEKVDARWQDDRGRLRPQAGYERNEVMLRRSDRLIAFWDGDSPGTAQAIEKAREYKVKARTIMIDVWEEERAQLLREKN